MTDLPDRKGVSLEASTSLTASSELKDLEFKYPSIPLNLSLDSLLAHSSTTESTSSKVMTKSDTDTSSLAESWTSLAGAESSDEDDLQSEHTDVGSLLDVHSSDDIHSVVDADPTGESPADKEDASDGEDVQNTSTEDIGQTPKLSTWTRSDSHSKDPFEACLDHASNQEGLRDSYLASSDPYHTIRYFNEYEARAYRRRSQATSDIERYCIITRMGLSNAGLDLNTLDYFKVILLGTSIEQFRPEVQRKLGDVLVSQGGSSHYSAPGSITRYHLVPNTFGPGAEPDFADLVAIDKQIDFDCYDQVEERATAFSRTTTLCLKNRQTSSKVISRWDGRGFVVSQPRWVPPDLAIVCVELDGTGKLDQSSHNMIKFTERHGIPRIIIRLDRNWDGDYAGTHHQGLLHESIEEAPETSEKPQDMRAVATLPVHMASFLNLDSTLLNKHIAHIVSNSEGRPSENTLLLSEDLPRTIEMKPNRFWGNLSTRLSNQEVTPIAIFILTLLLTSVVAILFAPYVLSALHHGTSNAIMINQTPEKLSGSMESSTSGTFLVAQTPLPSTIQEELTALAQTDDAWEEQFASTSVSSHTSVTDVKMRFQVGIASAGHLMVKLPKLATSRRKRSELAVTLTRGQQTLPVLVQELFDGVYSVSLQALDSYGDVELCLSMSNPRINETLTVSFGDQSIISYDKLRAALGVVSRNARESLTHASKVLLDDIDNSPVKTLVNNVLSIGPKLNANLQKIRAALSAARIPQPDSQLELQSWVVARTQMVRAELLHYPNQGVMQGRRVCNKILGRVAAAGTAVADRFHLVNVDCSRFKQKVHTTVMVNQLAPAQERAQHVMSKAVERLRWRNAGGQD